ncbi:MAG: DUF1611 domain-containing protein [Eubacterium sp.]
MKDKAIIYCEGHFGDLDGKTANGLIRHSKKYEITGVIDSKKSGQDSGTVLDNVQNNIPIFSSISDAITKLEFLPRYFIYGIAPADAFLSASERNIILQAMSLGMNIVIGLQDFISEDEEFIKTAARYHVKIIDIRKPPIKRYLHLFNGRINTVKIPRIAVFGTDCAIGKRTTAILLTKALRAKKIHAVMVGSGQTSLIQGEKYSVAMDAMPSEYMVGEFENAVMNAITHEKPDVLIMEGQSALSHPAFVSSLAILRGGKPNAIIVQDVPKRKMRVDFPDLEVPDVGDEIELIEKYSGVEVIAITINHEDMDKEEVASTIKSYEKKYDLPVTDTLIYGCNDLVQKIIQTFPELQKKIKS